MTKNPDPRKALDIEETPPELACILVSSLDNMIEADDDNPEWTADDFARARPALEMISELFGDEAAENLRRNPVRLQQPDRKVGQPPWFDESKK